MPGRPQVADTERRGRVHRSPGLTSTSIFLISTSIIFISTRRLNQVPPAPSARAAAWTRTSRLAAEAPMSWGIYIWIVGAIMLLTHAHSLLEPSRPNVVAAVREVLGEQTMAATLGPLSP